MTKDQIEHRIKIEYAAHKELDWAKIAAQKIHDSLSNKIYSEEDIANAFNSCSEVSLDNILKKLKL
jgi:hypothetical protein